MRVLVTGGAGFIGSHIVESLWKEGVEVAVLDNLATGKRENVPQGIYFYKVDLRDKEGLERVFREFRPTHVSHQAAQASVKVSVENPLLDFEVNLMGGLNLLEACRKWGVEKLVFASTGGAIYGEVPEGESAEETWPPRPKSPYAASKASFEHYLSAYGQNYGLKWVALRYANVYGPRQDPHGEAGVVAIFAERVLKGEPVTLYARKTPGDEGCVRDYIYVEDVVRAHHLALRGLEGVYNVGTGEGHTTKEVLEAVAEAVGKTPEVKAAPPRPGDLERSVLSPLKLMAHGWRPEVGFREGIRRTVAYFRKD
ncbi:MULTISPECIES: SDR family oxidoreductase [Thermus]|jgi:UDP-glucose 4-epimerase|uniref:UDP-glucose 4-epimerase n=1 Tax=Thermus brockianus TaxID=56956 RepID=A0A1J0LQV4_THEBO|nr:SDR family oxidoreductase [Thermus brockianus]APD08434.1 UDP-glucose 4-epimerase [Thermus brockianus]